MSTPLRVLILEDRPADAELMLYELRRAGFDPTWRRVETEVDYLGQLEEPFDVILADYTLPQFDALRALHLLKARGRDIPFIVVTGAVGDEVAATCIKQGATDYLLKDRLARLGQAVTHALQGKQLRAERQRAEKALRQAEEKYHGLFENATNGIFQISPEGRFITANPALARILGYNSPEELMETVTDAMRQLYVDPLHSVALRRLLEEPGAIHNCEGKVYRKDRSVIWIYENVRACRNAGRELLCYEGALKDITQRKRAEEALRKAHSDLVRMVRELERKNKETEHIIHVISHDLKSPLISIQGFANELRRLLTGKLKGEVAFYLDRIRANVARMENLVHDLLDFSKVERMDTTLKEVRLPDVIKSVLEQLDYQIKAKGIEVKIRRELPIIVANRAEIERVFINLISNAVTYMGNIPNPRIEIDCGSGYRRWLFIVQDNGIGIPREYHRKIFDLFERLPEAQKVNATGTGVGLAIVKRIVEFHGGHIWVVSSPGCGATFLFTLAKGQTKMEDNLQVKEAGLSKTNRPEVKP